MRRRLTLIHFLLLVFITAQAPPATAQGGDTTGQPTLRIETGMHTDAILRIGVDAANLYFVTASFDNTVRVWELTTGRLLKTMRPPIGIGTTAVAISPDGSIVAAAGWGGGKEQSVYLFERESGRLARRLVGGMSRSILDLVYSGDGRYLVATMASEAGIRVFRTSDYTQVGKDLDYGDRCNSAAFDGKNRLVTVSHDGFIRLYEVRDGGPFKLLVKRKWTGGGSPSSASFNPDGSKIAVGAEESTDVGVLSGKDLSPLYFPDTRDITGGELSTVAWSRAGDTLYAGGYYRVDNLSRVRAWLSEGRGVHRDIAVAVKDVTHLVPLKDGSMAYGAADPLFGIIYPNNDVLILAQSATSNNEGIGEAFQLSADASTIQFSYADGDRNLARFSIRDRRLYTEPFKGENLSPPRTKGKGVSTADLFTAEPRLNGKTLSLAQFENPICIAVTPDGKSALLGTSYGLYLYDAAGEIQWVVGTRNTAVWAINISADGKYSVAALRDGTIRWYRMTDGAEMLTLFPHADQKRWVLWTPSGYYDASPGGEDLIGWHVHNGWDVAADFFPVAQFRSVYYRPDVVARMLKTGDERLALKEANSEAERRQPRASVAQMLPPVVEIISPADASEFTTPEVTLRFKTRTTPGAPVTNIRVLVDGRPATVPRGLVEEGASASGTISRRVILPERDSEVSVIAENRFTASVPATVRLRWKGAEPSEEVALKPKLYVLSIGISKYANPQYDLRFAAKDANDFAAFWRAQKGSLYRDVEVRVLADQQATKDEVLDGLDWIRKETTQHDVAMIFFSGHGINDTNGAYYFLPHNTDVQRLLRTGVSFADIKLTAQTIAGKAIFFVDSCHAGNVMGGTRHRELSSDINRFINELSSAENGVIVFSSSSGSQSSLEDPAWGNGAFTKALIEGLSGEADQGRSGRVTINMLDYYISERVKTLTNRQQTPTTAKQQTQDFPIALSR